MFGFYVQFLPTWVPFSCWLSNILSFYLLFSLALLCVWMYIMHLSSVSKHIDTSRKEISTELKELVKLCRWEQDKSYSSIENLKKSRQKLKKLIKKHTVSSTTLLACGLVLYVNIIGYWKNSWVNLASLLILICIHKSWVDFQFLWFIAPFKLFHVRPVCTDAYV